MAITGAALRHTFLDRLLRCAPKLTSAMNAAVTGRVTPTMSVGTWEEGLSRFPLGHHVGGLIDTLLMAVPKKRTTYSKKRKRMMNKYLRPTKMMIQCEICDRWKRPHLYCSKKCPGRKEMAMYNQRAD